MAVRGCAARKILGESDLDRVLAVGEGVGVLEDVGIDLKPVGRTAVVQTLEHGDWQLRAMALGDGDAFTPGDAVLGAELAQYRITEEAERVGDGFASAKEIRSSTLMILAR